MSVTTPTLVEDGWTEGGDDLLSVETESGERYFFAKRDPTTLELRSIDCQGRPVPSDVVSGMSYEDLLPEIRAVVKRDGYRMIPRNGFLAGLM